MNKTDISYLTHTWTPIAMRCTKVSPACDHCWHLSWAKRHAGNPNFTDKVRAAYAGDAPPLLVEHRLLEPLKMRKPARVGVQFMGDLFHEDVPTKFIADVWSIMYHTWKHTFQILTKRPRRMAQFVKGWNANAQRLPSNIQLGVTAEDQQRADERIPILLSIPAAFHYVSLEPLLSGMDIARYLPQRCAVHNEVHYNGRDCLRDQSGESYGPFLRLAIVGGETGPGARPMKPAWARSLRDQCVSAGVGFHFKSWGEWAEFASEIEASVDITHLPQHTFDDGSWVVRVGAKRAGHLLDGVEWRETG